MIRNRSWARPSFWRLGLAMLMVLSLVLAACGGGDDDDSGGGSTPLVSGAKELDSVDFTDETESSLGVDISNGKTTVYKSDKSFDEVKTFYDQGLSDEWKDEGDQSFDPLLLRFFSKGDTVAIVTAMPGSFAKQNQEMITSGNDVEINFDEIGDNDTVLAIATFTCEEDDVSACVTAATS